MFDMFNTPLTSHALMSPLKLFANLNMPVMSVTPPTSQFEMSPSNESALWNMYFMFVTWLTFHLETLALKEIVLKNICCIFVTRPTSQSEMSTTNACAL